MSLPVILDAIDGLDMTLLSDLSWAGGKFPFAGTEDVTISANTTWSDAVGFKKVRKLTIAAGVTLRIIRTPFYLFADEIAFGSATSTIDISGFNGNQSDPAATFAKGGRNAGRTAGGGDGGGLLIICVSRITGSAGRVIANGGNGVGYETYGIGGQGALSHIMVPDLYPQRFDGSAAIGAGSPVLSFLHPLARLMAAGSAGSIYGGTGGGSGGYYNYGSGRGHGGSGIGGGGGGAYSSSYDGTPGGAAKLAPRDLLLLANYGCTGGGGGGNDSFSALSGGGGGGGVALWYRSATAVPTLSANGGSGSGGIGYQGGAGLAVAIQV